MTLIATQTRIFTDKIRENPRWIICMIRVLIFPLNSLYFRYSSPEK